MRTVIFDMDGVLFDTERIYALAWDYAGEKSGIGKAGFMNMRMLGMSVDKTQEIWRQQFGDAYDEKAVRFYAREFVRDYLAEHGVPEKAGMRELLEYLRENGWKMAVASSSPRSEVERNLALAGIDGYFGAVVCGDMVCHSKPDPDIYIKACELLGEKPENCFAVEDSRNGIISAVTAGCKTIMVPDLWECDHPTKKILHLLADSLAEVRRHFEQLVAEEEDELAELSELLFVEEEQPTAELSDDDTDFSGLLFNENDSADAYSAENAEKSDADDGCDFTTDNGYRIISYERSDEAVRERLIDYLAACKWGAGRYLATLLPTREVFNDDDRAYFMLDGDKIVSFLTLAHTDCIDDDTMPQWIGFVYTAPEYRGCRNMGRLLAFAEDKAREKGFSQVFLATDHVGLYEKYGFRYLKNMLDRKDEDSRIYVYDL